MVDMGWQHFRGQALGCMIGVLLLGCGQGSTQRDGFREEKQALEEDTEAPSASTASEAVEAVVESDGPTSTAVTVAWQDQNDSKVSSQFPVLVTNTSPVVQSVELLLAGATPSNQIIEQSFMNLVLAPQETRVVSIHVDDLPVQSTLHASALRVVARYIKRGTKLRAFTEPLMLTFESTFKTATARKVGEQIRVDSDVADLAAYILEEGEVRIRNPGNAAFSQAAVDDSDSRQGPTLILSQLDVPADFDNSPHFADTEVPQGD